MTPNQIKKMHFIITVSTFNTHYLSNEMSQIEKLLSVKGKPMILHEGYIYTVERTTTTKLIFRCQNRDCKGKFALNINQSVQMKIIF